MAPFTQDDSDRIFTELGTLRVELDDDPLTFGPKRLNNKTAEVRRMLDRCETLFLDVSQKLQRVRRNLRMSETDLDLARKNLFANDPETRAGRSVSDREAIAAGKLEKEIRNVHELTLASEDLDAVLVVIKAKRADLKDTEGRLRDQIRLCSEEIGLGGRWGSKVPNAPEIQGRPAFHTATGADISDVADMLQGLDGEIQLSRDGGTWEDPPEIVTAPVVEEPTEDPSPTFDAIMGSVPLPTPVKVAQEPDQVDVDKIAGAILGATEEKVPEVESPLDVSIENVPTKDLETHMAQTTNPVDVDIFLSEVTVSSVPLRPDMSKIIHDVDVDSILDMFESV